MLRVARILINSKGRPIALIGFDLDENEWRINIYDACGFPSEQAAFEFWQGNFDPETGMLLRASDQGIKQTPGSRGLTKAA